MKQRYYRPLIIVIVFLAALIRFYDFDRLMIFDPERAMSLMTSAQLLERPSLLGPPYFRATLSGHQLFNSPTFNYLLIPPLLLFNYHPLPVTVLFTLLNLFTGFMIFWLGKKLIHPVAALLAAVLFLFNSQMIFHSRFVWIIHPFPLFGLISLYLLSKRRAGWLGFLTGLGIGMDYTYLFFGLPVFLVLMFRSSNRPKTFLSFTAGGLIGDSPHVLFDLRHQFYNLSTLWQYTLETWANPGQSKLLYYHFFPLWPALALLGGIGLYQLGRRSHSLAGIILVSYLIINLKAPLTFSTYEITLKDQMRAAAFIAEEKPVNFNVVSLLDFDTRGHVLRYLLQYRHQLKPAAVDNYKNVDVIYALARIDYNLDTPANYELTSFYPYQIKELLALDSTHGLYKLSRYN